MSKVFLGVGHGGNDPGAVGYLVEKDVNLNMAKACRDYLEANGVKVKMSRTKDENDDLNEEIQECNAYDPDLAVDIHNNAGNGDGFEVYHSVFKGIGTTLAKNIEAEVKAIGQNSRGCKSKWNSSKTSDYYGFIRLTKAPAVICEGVFVDNKEDVKIADTLEEQRAFGIAYAKGILKTLGITSNNKPKIDNETKSIVELANEVIAGKYGNGEERKKALGSLYEEVQEKVNEILGSKTSNSTSNKKSNNTIAEEVIAGKWGNGTTRKEKLEAAGYDYNTIQDIVNEKLGSNSSSKKSNETIANEVIKGLWGNGEDRKNRLTKAGYDYNAIQKIVNSKLS